MNIHQEINNLIKNKALMSYNQYYSIYNTILHIKNNNLNNKSNILVFGLGNDSFLWNKLNINGLTLFVEDNLDWINKFKNDNNQNDNLNIYHHNYNTLIKDWDKYYNNNLGFENDKLLIKLKGYEDIKWDIILVDGPVGHPYPCKRNTSQKKCNLCPCPGRMSSIYTASRIIKKNGGVVIVDDYGRNVERLFSNKFLDFKNYKIIENKLAIFYL